MAPLPPSLRLFLTTPITARTWREHAYLAAAGPLALAGLIALFVMTYLSVLAAVTLVGIPIMALTLLGAYKVGGVHRWLANVLLHERVATPRRRRPTAPGFFPWLKATLGDTAAWRSVAFIIVSFPLLFGGVWAAIAAWGAAIACLSYPIVWQVFEPTNTDSQGVVHHSAMQFGEFYIDTWPRALMICFVGLVGVFVVPWIVRGLATVDRLLVRGLLGPTRMSERVVDLETTRAQAVDASAANLRRIERDLHDGTQARLVALAMHLDMAKEKLAGVGGGAGSPGSPGSPGDAGSPGGTDDSLVQARDLLDTAHRNATEAIVELRDVTRSIHPPALDKGLDAALATLAARSAVPASVRTDLMARPSPAIETIAYFCVAELLTNAAKHSGARRVAVDVTGGPSVVRLRVSDDGGGGAVLRPGGGLAGLAERVRTVDGSLSISSPAGGPTVITIELPAGTGR